jgi:hypothetical protein
MNKHLIDRFLLLLAVVVCAFLTGQAAGAAQPADADSAPASAQGAVQNGLVPRFLDFDIGAATVRSGATHQDSIADIPPYVLLPNPGTPLTMVNFTIPPDFDTGGDFEARLLWSAYAANSFPCFFVLRTELVGYGPGHSADLFDPYWDGAGSTNDEFIVQTTNSSIRELPILFQSLDSFPAYPGDIVTFTLWRDANDVNDTCNNTIALRSISFTYQGLTTYLPLTIRSQ